jgi:hypothetical protein
MKRVTIPDYVWNWLDEDLQAIVKSLATRHGSYWGYNFDYDYYEVDFTDEGWVLAKLAEPEIAQRLESGFGSPK